MSEAPSVINPDQDRVAEFSRLTGCLQRGGVMEPDDIRCWCELGLELRQPAMVQGVCENLLDAQEVHSALRPYWLYFLGTALLHQHKLDKGVESLRQGLEALCVAPRVYNAKPTLTKFEDPRVIELLWQTLAQLAAGGVKAFAHAGTLLGLVREQRLLPFDKDLDLGLMVQELPLAGEILGANSWQCPLALLPMDNMIAYYHPETEVTLDLCGLETPTGSSDLFGGFRVNQGEPLAWQRITRYLGPLRLETASSPAGNIWQLEDPEPWLVTMYGESWHVPDPDFDTTLGAYNIVGFSNLTRWYAYSRIMSPWLEGYWEKALRLTRLVLERHVPNDALLLEVAKTLEDHLATLK